MFFILLAGSVALLLCLGLVLFQEIGRRLGRSQRAAGVEPQGFSSVEGAVFALLGLLTAFSFDGAATRFQHRRDLITEEVNAIGTAYARLDLLPERPRHELQDKFRGYLTERLAIYRALPDFVAAREALARSKSLEAEIWSRAVAAVKGDEKPFALVLLPPINAMFDAATTRTFAAQSHPPTIVFFMLAAVALLSALLAGHGMSPMERRPTFHMVVYAATLAAAVYVILELEFPRLGLIRLDDAEQNLVNLLQQLK